MSPWLRKEELAEGVTLYLGDMLEVLPALGEFDACVTDPPYGIGSWSASGGNSISAEEALDANRWDVAPPKEAFDVLRSVTKEQIFWGANYFIQHLGNCRSPLIWDKKQRGVHFADGELAWTSFKGGTLRIFEASLQSTDIRQVGRWHPTQKPIEVMAWCLDKLPGGFETILDPCMGSGTTGVACAKRGLSFTGIEREPKYFDIAVRRISDALSRPDLFIERPAAPKQEALL